MANSSQNEIELLEASIRGSTAAFESIVKKYQSFVCAITFSAIPDVEKSEDLAQETFLHAWNNLSQLQDLKKFRSWLISIARNIINDSLRKQRRDLINRASPIEEIEDKQIKKSEPSQRASAQEQQAVVQEALMQIPEKYREPLVLFYRHEKSVKYIAEQFDMSEELVKQHLSRGRKLLREQVASMVEKTISKTGPTSIFTSAVMVSIIGMAVKSTGAAAAAAGSFTAVSSITTKIIAAAAVVTLSIGTVVTYKHFKQPEKNIQTPVDNSSTDNVLQGDISDNAAPAANIDLETAAIQEPGQLENVSAVNAGQNNLERTVRSNQYEASTANISSTPVIALKNQPSFSPYEYFMFTRYNQEPSTRTLVLAHITANGIVLKDIVTEDFGTYHWGDPICVTGGKLYSKSYSTLYSIDLLTKETEQLSVRSNTLDYSFNFSASTVFADNCLYGLARKGNTIILRQLDFERGAYRDIANVSKAQPSKDIAISPERKRLAYFATQPGDVTYPSTNKDGYFLTIVDVETGQISQLAKPINFIVAMIASSFPGIPTIWLDSETVAFVRTKVPVGNNPLDTDSGAVHMLSTANVNTDVVEDILPLPGNPYVRFAPDLIQDNVGIGPRVWIRHEEQGDYRLDLKNRKLVEDDLVAGDYRIAFGHLYYKDRDLGPAERGNINVSSDGKRVIWKSAEQITYNNAQDREAAYRAAMQSNNTQLYYYDEAQDEPVPIAKVYNSVGLWIKPDDLKTQQLKNNLSEEWTALKNITESPVVRTSTQTRKNIRDYITCTIKTDKNTYFLNEPIFVTITFTNKSDSDILIMKPGVFGSVMSPLTGLTLSYPGGQKRIDSGAQPYSPADEEILLKTGQSVSDINVVEVSLIGDYQLEYKYQNNNMQGFIGSFSSEPVSFNVAAVEDAAAEHKLFDAKFARLMDKFHREIEMDPNWNGNNNTVSDKITGLPGMGPGAAPYLIEAIRNETLKNSRELLFRALSSVAGPEYLPYFKERLANGETESVCQWILDTYRTRGGDKDIRQQAVEALLAGMNNETVEARKEICSYLMKIYDEKIEDYFEKNIGDEDERIRLDAGYYLAAAKWLELADWLKLAITEPNYVNYISASAVIQKLEQQWNISKGKLPILSKKEFDDAERNQQARKNYKEVIQNWLSWANENPRASFQFFEEYRRIWWENDPLRQE